MRMSLDQISILGRATQGVRLINLKNDQIVATVSLVDKDNEIEDNSENEPVVETNNTVEQTTSNE